MTPEQIEALWGITAPIAAFVLITGMGIFIGYVLVLGIVRVKNILARR